MNPLVVEVEMPPEETEDEEEEEVDYENLSEKEKAVEDFWKEKNTKLRHIDTPIGTIGNLSPKSRCPTKPLPSQEGLPTQLLAPFH